MNVIITVGAVSAIVGVIEYGVLNYDSLGQRPRGTLGHYMTYSGLLMLVICATAARLLYSRRDRIWPALVMPALVVALALTFTRNAWVGGCVGVGAAPPPARLPAVRARCRSSPALFFALAPTGDYRAVLLDVQPERPDQPRSRRDGPGRHRDRQAITR